MFLRCDSNNFYPTVNLRYNAVITYESDRYITYLSSDELVESSLRRTNTLKTNDSNKSINIGLKILKLR